MLAKTLGPNVLRLTVNVPDDLLNEFEMLHPPRWLLAGSSELGSSVAHTD
jgi:hypothetical protein